MRWSIGLLAAVTALGCQGRIMGVEAPDASVPAPIGADARSSDADIGLPGADASVASGDAGTGNLSNLDVYTRLKVTCGGCHSLTDRPYFATLESFEGSIAYDPRWVTPGDPSTSALMDLLDGTRPVRMPPPPLDPFAVMAMNGQTQISIAEIEAWITSLVPRVMPPALDVPVVRRMTAEQVVRSLYDQLGLTDADLYTPSWDPLSYDTYAVRSPDGTPGTDPYNQSGVLFLAMGGPWRLEGKLRNDTLSQGFVQALTHVSQAWCRTAILKTGNTAVLSRATLSDSSATPGGTASIRANIVELYLRMLGLEPPPAEVDDLFDNVFKPYERQGAVVAWTAVCAALVRDPLWILY